MKVLFFGSSDYCLPILESLSKNFDLIAVITKSGQAVEKFAQRHNIEVFVPDNNGKLQDLKEILTKRNPDIAIVADYGLLIPPEIFSIPRFKTLNIHFSKLPKFRGPSPVQYTLLYGEKSAWISIIIMDAQIDTGDIVWQKEIPLASGKSTNQPITETTADLYIKLFNIVALNLPEVLNKYAHNELKPQKQENSLASYTKHLTREDGYIPPQLLEIVLKGISATASQLSEWNLFKNLLSQLLPTNHQLPTFIEQAVRAFSPWPGLWTEVTINQSTNQPINTNQPIKKRLKILKTHLESSTTNHQPPIKFILDLVQLEGKKPVSWKQFCEGYPEAKFEVYP